MSPIAHKNKLTINAKTGIVGLLGYPVEHSSSPLFQNRAIEAMGINAVYLALSVKPEDFEDAFKGLSALGALGANFTLPHKQSAYKLCDECSPEARVIEAVNTVKFKDGKAYGYNTDAYGVKAAINEQGYKFTGKKIAVLGAGGVSRAIVTQTILDGASEIYVVNRTVSKAEDLLSSILNNCRKLDEKECPYSIPTCHAVGYEKIGEALRDADILINATSIGLKETDPMLIDPKYIEPSFFVYDTIYNPSQTRFLIAAKQRGCRKTSNGLSMLLYQGAKAFELWFERSAPIELMRQQLMHPRAFS